MQLRPHQPHSLKINDSEALIQGSLTRRSQTNKFCSNNAQPIFQRRTQPSLAPFSRITISSGPLISLREATTLRTSPPQGQASKLLQARRNRQIIRTASTSHRLVTASSFSRIQTSTKPKRARLHRWVPMCPTFCLSSQEGLPLGTKTVMVAACKL